MLFTVSTQLKKAADDKAAADALAAQVFSLSLLQDRIPRITLFRSLLFIASTQQKKAAVEKAAADAQAAQVLIILAQEKHVTTHTFASYFCFDPHS